MELIRDCFSLQSAFPGSALTVGNFDGVHVGHQRILARLVASARAASSQAVAFTFDPHPEAVLNPGRAPERILTLDRKLELLETAGIDAVICPDGPLAVLAMSAEEFVRRIVVDSVGAALVVEGPNFVFGRDRVGNDELLRQMGAELGFRLEVASPVLIDGREVSSTRIRGLVREGRVTEANRMLGRPFEFVGTVVHGRDRGRGLGFPTANLAGGDFLVPGDGVYAGWAFLSAGAGARPEGPFAAAISVGRGATFGELPQPVVEAYIMDFDRDVYGQVVRLLFVQRVRGQKTFAGAASLGEQMGRDCQAIKAILSREPDEKRQK